MQTVTHIVSNDTGQYYRTFTNQKDAIIGAENLANEHQDERFFVYELNCYFEHQEGELVQVIGERL